MNERDYKAALERIGAHRRQLQGEIIHLKQMIGPASATDPNLSELQKASFKQLQTDETESDRLDAVYYKVQHLEQAAEQSKETSAPILAEENKNFSKEANDFRKQNHNWLTATVKDSQRAYDRQGLQQTEKLLEASNKIDGGALNNYEGYCIGNKCYLSKLQGLQTGPQTEAAIAKTGIINKELAKTGEAATPESVDRAVGRINTEIEKFNKEHGYTAFKPLQAGKFGDRSPEELNKLADWLATNSSKYSNHTALKLAGMQELRSLDSGTKNADDQKLDEKIKQTQLALAEIMKASNISPGVNPIQLNKPVNANVSQSLTPA